METLPTEIIEKIFCGLPRESICICSRVCKKWYASVTPILYETIILQSKKTIKLFYRTIIAEDNHSAVNIWVKHLRFINIRIGLIESVNLCNSTTELDYFENYEDISQQCPNIETIIVNNEVFHDKWLSEAKKAFKNKIANRFYRVNEYEFLSTAYEMNALSDLQLMSLNENSYTAFGGMIEYLGLFPYLTWLTITMTDTSTVTNVLLMQILQQCPRLFCLFYEVGLDTDHLFDAGACVEYPSLKALKIIISHMTAHHHQYIHKTFTGLKLLKLIVKDSSYHSVPVYEILNAVRNVKRLILILHDYTKEEIKMAVNDFWLHIERLPPTVVEQTTVEMLYNSGLDSIISQRLELSINTRNTYDKFYCFIQSTEPCLSYFMGNQGVKIDTLYVNDFPVAIDAKELNRTFPSLDKFELGGNPLNIDLDDLPPVHNSLKTLFMNVACVRPTSLLALHKTYPNLYKLTLHSSDLYPGIHDSVMSNKTYRVSLLWTQLQFLNIIVDSSVFKKIWIIIVKMEHGAPVTCWHMMNEQTQFTYEDYTSVLKTLIENPEQPTLLLESESIKNAIILC